MLFVKRCCFQPILGHDDSSDQGFFVIERAGTAYRQIKNNGMNCLKFLKYGHFGNFRSVSTGKYFLVPANTFFQKALVATNSLQQIR